MQVELNNIAYFKYDIWLCHGWWTILPILKSQSVSCWKFHVEIGKLYNYRIGYIKYYITRYIAYLIETMHFLKLTHWTTIDLIIPYIKGIRKNCFRPAKTAPHWSSMHTVVQVLMWKSDLKSNSIERQQIICCVLKNIMFYVIIHMWQTCMIYLLYVRYDMSPIKLICIRVWIWCHSRWNLSRSDDLRIRKTLRL